MNFDDIKDINIRKYELPLEIYEAWDTMLEFIEESKDKKNSYIQHYFKFFLTEMESKGYEREEVINEVKLYFQQRDKLRQLHEYK